MFIKHFIKSITSSKQRNRIRKFRRDIKKRLFPKSKTSLAELKNILVQDFGLKKGDNIIVASSFGNLNANYSPQDVIQLLQSIVTEEGSIMMPYYPPINSTEWVKTSNIFDMERTKSGMGILTNIFSKMPGVVKSIHPIKAVCVWGKNAKEIISNHENSTTPFYWDSPYGKYLKIHSKSLGLGLKNIPIFHAFEDILSKPYDTYYQKEKYTLFVKNGNNAFPIKTYVHDNDILDRCISAGDYVASLKCKSYKKINFGYTFLYVIDNDDLYQRLQTEFKNGNTRIRK